MVKTQQCRLPLPPRALQHCKEEVVVVCCNLRLAQSQLLTFIQSPSPVRNRKPLNLTQPTFLLQRPISRDPTCAVPVDDLLRDWNI